MLKTVFQSLSSRIQEREREREREREIIGEKNNSLAISIRLCRTIVEISRTPRH